jgi:hypothetical protein
MNRPTWAAKEASSIEAVWVELLDWHQVADLERPQLEAKVRAIGSYLLEVCPSAGAESLSSIEEFLRAPVPKGGYSEWLYFGANGRIYAIDYSPKLGLDLWVVTQEFYSFFRQFLHKEHLRETLS